MKVLVDRKSPVSTSYRAERCRGLFNVSEEDGSSFSLEADIPLELDGWQVGVVVGSSGSGKSSIGQEIVAQKGWRTWQHTWKKGLPLIDSIAGDDHTFDQITAVLSTVGLGSVPAWLRPFEVLSNGEQFRAEAAALLLRGPDKVVIDEFSSVLDRQVACVGSAAFVKALRKQKQRQVVLLSCHRDVLDWILPEWVYDTDKKMLFMGEVQTEKVDANAYPEVGRLTIKR